VNRRRFLQAAAATGGAWLAGCFDIGGDETSTPSRTPTTTPPETEPPTTPPTGTPAGTETPVSTEREVVEADVSPGDEVSDIVEDIEAGELLVFPSGRFTWSTTAHVIVDDWGIKAQDDTVFEVPSGAGIGDHAKLLATHLAKGTADNFVLENLTFDSPGRAAPALLLGVRNQAHVDGLQYRMNGPLDNQMHDNGLKAYVTNEDGVLQVDGYRQFNNADLGAYADGTSRVGVWVGPKNRGTVHLRNPVLQGFPNNACYVSRQPGTVVIEGGLLMNNNVSAVRVSGGVEVVDTTVYIDIDRYLDGPGTIAAPAHNTRGVWGDSKEAGTRGGLVRNTSFIIRSYRRSTGLATMLNNPKMTVRNCQFRLDTDLTGVQADDGKIVVDDCHFSGESTGSTAGIGSITGPGGYIAPNIDPGDVPVQDTDSTFDWSRTHPETPGRASHTETLLPAAFGRFAGD
jgi:hypothetical protein